MNISHQYTPISDPTGQIDKKTRKARVLGTEISIDAEEAEIVTKIFEMSAAGFGLRAIAMHLNDQGVKPARGGRRSKGLKIEAGWCPHGIRYMLSNEKYVGRWVWNKYRWVKNRKTGKRRRILNAENDWTVKERPELAIIDTITWERVRARFDSNRREGRGFTCTPKKTLLLSGLMKCIVCGANLVVVGKRANDHLYGCCTNHTRGEKICPNNLRIRRAEIEDKVLAAISKKMLNTDTIDEIVKCVRAKLSTRRQTGSTEQAVLRKKLQKYEVELKNLIGFIAAGDTSSTIRDAVQEREVMVENLNLQLSQIATLPTTEDFKIDRGALLQKLGALSELLYKDVVRSKSVMSQIIRYFEIEPHREGKQKYAMVHGIANVSGLLAVSGDSSKIFNSGGRI